MNLKTNLALKFPKVIITSVHQHALEKRLVSLVEKASMYDNFLISTQINATIYVYTRSKILEQLDVLNCIPFIKCCFRLHHCCDHK